MGIASKIRQYIREEIRGMYTVSYVIVEEVNYDDMEVRISLKRDKEAVFWVPIASIFADGDGYGFVVPIRAKDEGLLLHTKSPTNKLTVEKGHENEFTQQRVFDINDAVFLPMFWNDNDMKPNEVFTDFKEGDMLISHAEDTFIHIKGEKHPDPGTVYIETSGGLTFEMDNTSGEEQITAKTDTGAGIKIDKNSGWFKLLEASGYGIEGDGSGNFTWHAADVNIEDSTTSL